MGILHANVSTHSSTSVQAEDDARAALEYDPCFVKAYVRAAKACDGLEKWDEAMVALRDALEVEPANKEVCSKWYVLRPTGNRRKVGIARC